MKLEHSMKYKIPRRLQLVSVRKRLSWYFQYTLCPTHRNSSEICLPSHWTSFKYLLPYFELAPRFLPFLSYHFLQCTHAFWASTLFYTSVPRWCRSTDFAFICSYNNLMINWKFGILLCFQLLSYIVIGYV